MDAPRQAALTKRATWLETARSDQLPPGHDDWTYWLVLAGRGFGKTRLAMEDAAWYGETHPNERISLIAATYADARDTMVEGQSGLLSCLADGMVSAWNRSLGEIVLTNGTRYKLFAATEPDRLRGPQHHRAYCDELAAWEYPDTWDQMAFGLRLGEHPKVVIATTPKPVPLVRRIMSDPRTHIVRGSTFDNAANLSAVTLDQLKQKYEGTRLGRQELYAEVLDDVPGALWTRALIDQARKPVDVPQLVNVVVAVDPSGARGEEDERSDEIGIVIAGRGVDGRCYVLDDWTCKLSPQGWGSRAVQAYHHFKANQIVAEINYGGAMVEYVVKNADAFVPFKMVTASRGKIVRAEPVAMLYEQGKVTHVGKMEELEDQLCAMTPNGYLGDGSPDRADALVWAVTEVMMLGLAPMTISDEMLNASRVRTVRRPY